MADPVGILKQIAEVAFKIKEAVETVRQNKEECLRIGRRVTRVGCILLQLPNTEMTNNPAMSAALEELDKTLRRAHTLVTACQEKNTMCLFCTATKLSKKLRRAKDDISDHMMEGIFAIAVTIIMMPIQDDDAHPPPPKDTGPARSQRHGLTPMRLRPSKKIKQARRRRPQPAMFMPNSLQMVASSVTSTASAAAYEGSEMSSPPSSSLIEFSLTELEVATQHFSTIVGQGGFATVYKGVLSDGLVVAVKKLANVSPSSDDEAPINHPFVRLCSMLEHKNIVRLLGYCHGSREEHMPSEDTETGFVQANQEFSLLVQEYMPNGTLSDVIYGSQLDWISRFRIIQGITHGVIYLHTQFEKPIVHLDLKPDNILLDSDMNPKIGDFGSARILDDQKMAIVCGTLGYMPPEYIVEGVISVKNDVYGFGVTLLETISGMRRSGPAVRRQASIGWAWKVHQAGAMNGLFDPLLCDQSQLKEIKRCMEIGLLCTQKKPTDRPTMPDVLQMLNGKKKLPTPKLPGYIKHVLRGNVQ